MFRGFAILTAVTSLATATLAQVGPAPTLYRLDASTTFEEGCQPPCACPIAITSDVFGTFTLRYTSSDPAGFKHYAVERVNWSVEMPGSVRRVSGGGEYKVGGQFAITQQLQLGLSFDNGTTVQFDSGLVPGGSLSLIDIDIARNGFYCWDQVFRLSATPVPASAIVPYHLVNSSYMVGCLPPCLCPIFTYSIAGSFNLVDLGPASTVTMQHYALVDIHWQTLPSPAPPDQNFNGFGIYRLDAGAGKQRLICDLTDGNGLKQRFDSGDVVGGNNFPAKLEVQIALNGFNCYDKVFDLHAIP